MADERKYYVICAAGCRFESMSKEQILAAIEQAISTGEIKDVDTGFVTKIKEQNGGAALTFWVGTTAQYNAIKEKTKNCFYIITDDTRGEDIDAAIKSANKRITELAELYTNLLGSVNATNEKRGKTLFSGSWDGSSDLTVNGLSDYKTLLINGVLCTRKDGRIVGTVKNSGLLMTDTLSITENIINIPSYINNTLKAHSNARETVMYYTAKTGAGVTITEVQYAPITEIIGLV